MKRIYKLFTPLFSIITVLFILSALSSCLGHPSRTVDPQSISLGVSELSLNIGDTVHVSATVLPANTTDPTVFWRSTDPAVATVTGGEICALNEGECEIVASCGELEASCHVTVSNSSKDKLSYTLLDDGTYSVGRGRLDSSTVRLVIPNEYCGARISTVDDGAFSDFSELISIKLPDTLVRVGEAAFSYCTSLTDVSMPDGVRFIGSSAFYGCAALRSITLGNSLQRIGASCFEGCRSLEEISLPASVTQIGAYALYGCASLENITVGAQNEFYASLDGSLYTKDMRTLIQYATASCATDFTVPDSVRVIGERAFAECKALTCVRVHSAVESISQYAFEYSSTEKIIIEGKSTLIGRAAFYRCNSLTELCIPFGQGQCTYLGYLFGAPTKEQSAAFIPASVSKIKLTYCTEIGENAFHGCDGLLSISLPEELESIGDSAFYSCRRLIEVCNPGDLEISTGKTDNGCVALRALNVCASESDMGEFTLTDDGFTFYSVGDRSYLVAYSSDDSSIILPDSINGSTYEIISYAFHSQADLKSIYVPRGVTSIGFCAFEGCTSLTAASFELTDAWYADGAEIANVSSSELCARYLTDTYCYSTWTRKE